MDRWRRRWRPSHWPQRPGQRSQAETSLDQACAAHFAIPSALTERFDTEGLPATTPLPLPVRSTAARQAGTADAPQFRFLSG